MAAARASGPGADKASWARSTRAWVKAACSLRARSIRTRSVISCRTKTRISPRRRPRTL